MPFSGLTVVRSDAVFAQSTNNELTIGCGSSLTDRYRGQLLVERVSVSITRACNRNFLVHQYLLERGYDYSLARLYQLRNGAHTFPTNARSLEISWSAHAAACTPERFTVRVPGSESTSPHPATRTKIFRGSRIFLSNRLGPLVIRF